MPLSLLRCEETRCGIIRLSMPRASRSDRSFATADRSVIPGNSVGAQLAANPLAQKLIKALYPFTPGVDTPYIHWLRPDGLPATDGNNAIFARGTSTFDNRWSVKVDQILGVNDRMAVRYSSAPVIGTRFHWAGPSDPSDPIVQDQIYTRNAAASKRISFRLTR